MVLSAATPSGEVLRADFDFLRAQSCALELVCLNLANYHLAASRSKKNSTTFTLRALAAP